MSVFHKKVTKFLKDSEYFVKMLTNSKLNDLYWSLSSTSKQRIFVKMATERFFREDLSNRAYLVENICRWCENNTKESIFHVIDCQKQRFTEAEILAFKKINILKRKYGFETIEKLGNCLTSLSDKIVTDKISLQTPLKKRKIAFCD